jgi:DNA invertase Pin-like site-specific DNA recombinase
VSGTKTARPGLDRLVKDAKRRKFDVLVTWKLDRLGRKLKHLITLLEDLQALGVALISLGEGIDATTPAGKLQMHILGAIAEFERGRIVERGRAGLQRARAQGIRLGRPPAVVPFERVQGVASLPADQAAGTLGVSRSTIKRWRRQMSELARGPVPLGAVER